MGVLEQLGMPLYGCQTPDGYKDTEAAWLNPDAMTPAASSFARARWRRSAAIARGAAGAALGGAVSSRRSPGLAVAGRNRNPLRAAMLLGSPDFMRR